MVTIFSFSKYVKKKKNIQRLDEPHGVVCLMQFVYH